MELLKGADVTAAINDRIRSQLHLLTACTEVNVRPPKLAVIRVGERPDDISYERGAAKRMTAVGIECETFVYPEHISNEEFLREFDRINGNTGIDGILLLRPLPKQLDEEAVTRRISPEKDVDGISPANMAKVFMGDTGGFAPCTAEAVVEMLAHTGMELSGKNVAVIGRSMVVGKPLAMLLMQKNCTVTVCHTKTVNMREICRRADIVVAAAGRARMVDHTYASERTMALIDVGINYDETLGKLCGDIDTADVMTHMEASADSLITPVPGGVGTVTTSVLALHVLRAYQSWLRSELNRCDMGAPPELRGEQKN